MSEAIAVLLVLGVAIGGCHLTHEREVARRADAAVLGPDATALDAGGRCTFGFVRGGTPIHCEIDLGSDEACAETAMCVCDTEPGVDTLSERLACASPELVARGALTFADYCPAAPPASHSMTEVLEDYFGRASTSTDLVISPACDALPALIGVRPYVDCGAIASELCRCVTDCDLDGTLGRSCLDMPAEHVACITRRMWTSPDLCAFLTALPTLATRCE